MDGNFVGSTPSTIGVSAGDHLIRIEKNGYEPWERKLKISTGKVNINSNLEPDVKREQKTEATVPSTTSTPPAPSRDTGASSPETLVMIYLTSDPDGAEINVDDSVVGKAPMTLKLKPGKHTIRMFMNDYQNWVQWVTIEAGAELHIKATLTKSNI